MNAKELMKPAISNIVTVDGNELIVSSGNTADNLAGVTHSFHYDNVYMSCNQDEVFKGTALPLGNKIISL